MCWQVARTRTLAYGCATHASKGIFLFLLIYLLLRVFLALANWCVRELTANVYVCVCANKSCWQNKIEITVILLCLILNTKTDWACVCAYEYTCYVYTNIYIVK